MSLLAATSALKDLQQSIHRSIATKECDKRMKPYVIQNVLSIANCVERVNFTEPDCNVDPNLDISEPHRVEIVNLKPK